MSEKRCRDCKGLAKSHTGITFCSKKLRNVFESIHNLNPNSCKFYTRKFWKFWRPK